MDVEEQHRTVLATDRRQFTRLGNKISIRCLAVGDVNDDRRKSVRMLLTPRLGNLGCLLERGAHRSAPFRIWVEPEWKFHGLVHHSAGAIIRFLDSVFDAQRLTGQFTDRYQRAPAQFTAERWFTALFAVAQHTDVKVVVDGVRFGATDAQIMNKLVEYRRELLGLPSASLSAAKRVFHRLRLVHQKQETTRVLTTDFGLVCHGLPPLLLASRELRLSHASGHRLESCRDHPQNAATPVPFATFAGTNCTRHAHCLIAPTARTRRDPDHRVTDLRRGVAESPSADTARGCDCLTIATD